MFAVSFVLLFIQMVACGESEYEDRKERKTSKV